LGSTQAGGINVGGLNMTVYDTIGAVTPNYPDYISIPFSSNSFSLSSGNWSAGTYVLTTSSSSSLPQYQAYNVFNSNSTTDLCWVSASGLYLNKNYKGTATTQVTDGSSNFTISGEWIQIGLPYKIISSLGNLSYGIQPRYINSAQNSPLSFTFMGSSSATTWTILDSKINYTGWFPTSTTIFPYSSPSGTSYQFQYFRLVISQISGSDTACGINQWNILGIPKCVITNSYLFEKYFTKYDTDSTYALKTSVINYQPQINTISSLVASHTTQISSIVNYQPQVDTISSLVASNTTQINTINTSINTISSSINTISGRVNTISSFVNTISGRVNTITSSLASYAPLNILQNYSLSSDLVAAGNTFSNGIVITNGDIFSPYLQTSQCRYTVTLGYHTSQIGYLYGLGEQPFNCIVLTFQILYLQQFQ
jgi:hypothetical protein